MDRAPFDFANWIVSDPLRLSAFIAGCVVIGLMQGGLGL